MPPVDPPRGVGNNLLIKHNPKCCPPPLFTTFLHPRRNQGGQGGHAPPPDFKIYAFGPPQISAPEINQHWLEIIFKHV